MNIRELVVVAVAVMTVSCRPSAAPSVAMAAPPLATTAAAQLAPAGVIDFDVSLFGAGQAIVPAVSPLTSAEESALQPYAAQMSANFSPYVYSGCQNRAHATFLLLPDNLKAKAMKVWVLSPGVYSVGFYGLIGLRGDGPGFSEVQWGFHVAVAFKTASGELRVLDSGVAPGQVLTKSSWLLLMKLPPLTLFTGNEGRRVSVQYAKRRSEQTGRSSEPDRVEWALSRGRDYGKPGS